MNIFDFLGQKLLSFFIILISINITIYGLIRTLISQIYINIIISLFIKNFINLDFLAYFKAKYIVFNSSNIKEYFYLLFIKGNMNII